MQVIFVRHEVLPIGTMGIHMLLQDTRLRGSNAVVLCLLQLCSQTQPQF